MKGKLYIVATPIGNLEDITLRALRILKEVDFIYAEDTRVTRHILKHYDIDCPLDNYHQHSKDDKKWGILKRLSEGNKIALVSDAGTPGISDPGSELVQWLLERDPEIEIVPMPGVSSVMALLSVAGMDVSQFLFAGFYPKKKRSKAVKLVTETALPVVFLDSPYRVIRDLTEIGEAIGMESEVVVGREMTKIHETFYRGSIKKVISELKKEKKLKGEVAFVVSPGRIPARNASA